MRNQYEADLISEVRKSEVERANLKLQLNALHQRASRPFTDDELRIIIMDIKQIADDIDSRVFEFHDEDVVNYGGGHNHRKDSLGYNIV